MATQDKNPKFIKENTLFFGGKGTGKSSMLVVASMLGTEQDNNRLIHYKNDIDAYPNLFDKSLKDIPNIRVNFDIKLNYYGGCGVQLMKFDPFKFMKPNNVFEYENIHKGCIYLCDEAQEYYDSYRYKEIPSFVYRVFELCRKLKTLLHLATHRYMRIAPAIRELYTSFVFMVKVEILAKDDYNKPSKIRLYYVPFFNSVTADEFYKSNNLSAEELVKKKFCKYYDFERTIFECFNTDEQEKEFREKISDSSLEWYKKKEKSNE